MREKAAAELAKRKDAAAIPALEAALQLPGEDEWVRLREAEALARLGRPAGLSVLRSLAEDGEAALVRTTAAALVAELAGAGSGAGRRTAEE